MTSQNPKSQVSEEMRELINEMVAEALHKRSLSHPGRREKVTRYTDPDGKTWVSTTLEKTEMIRKIAAAVSACAVLTGFINTIILFPLIDGRVDAAMKNHDKIVSAKMDEVMPKLTPKSDFDALVKVLEERQRHQEENYNRMMSIQSDTQKDIKELLKRR